MAQERRLMHDLVASDFFSAPPDVQNYFHNVFDMALCVYAAWNRQANQIHGGMFPEHQRADFHGTYAAFQVKFNG